MYSSGFYKSEARRILKGNYAPAFIGTIIYLLPSYLTYLIDYLLSEFTGFSILNGILDLAIYLFVLNIFNVGYMRFLLNIKPADDSMISSQDKRFDFNDVLSGYTSDFKNIFKTMLLRDIYLFLWTLIALIPMIILVGIVAYLSITTDLVSNLYAMMLQLLDSPTPDMLNNFTAYVNENCAYLPVISFIALVASAFCSIPSIYKSFEYAAVPIILAENPSMKTKTVFKRAYDIMHGFRWKYFCIQLSFILYLMLTSIAMLISVPTYYIAYALLCPYLFGTLLSFYKQRRDTVNYNISVYGEN